MTNSLLEYVSESYAAQLRHWTLWARLGVPMPRVDDDGPPAWLRELSKSDINAVLRSTP